MATTDNHTSRDDPSVELIESFLTAFVGGDADGIAKLVTDDCILHQPRWPLDTEGKLAIVEATSDNEGTFTDVSMTVNEAVGAGERIGAYVTASGRNVGPLGLGDSEIAPTGRAFEVPNFGIYRIRGGKIAEAWVLADALGIVEQLDNLPSGPGKMLRIALRQLRWRVGGRNPVE